MPLVYACICPQPPVIVPDVERGRKVEAARTIEALGRVGEELASYRPETALLVSPYGSTQHQAMGLLTATEVSGDFAQFDAPEVRFAFKTDQELAERIRQEAAHEELRLMELLRWDGGLARSCTSPLYYLREALGGATLLPITNAWLEPRFHFALGRAIGRALADYDRRVAFICSADLSHALSPDAPSGYDPAGRVFDSRYRRTIEAWDVKWLVNLDADFRRHAREEAVPQTAILMGALSGYRIQPRVLSYESPTGVGYLVAAIDVLGRRGKGAAQAKAQV
jgi:aromatic ring-opening dioxygenase LigB subunit